jgi:hypothetical protein
MPRRRWNTARCTSGYHRREGIRGEDTSDVFASADTAFGSPSPCLWSLLNVQTVDEEEANQCFAVLVFATDLWATEVFQASLYSLE